MSEQTTETGKISDELSRDIDESIDAVMAEIKDDAESGDKKDEKSGDDADDNKEIPSDEVQTDDDESEDISDENGKDVDENVDEDVGDEEDDDDKDAVTDDLLQRAVDAGLSIPEAREIGSAKALAVMCDKLEARAAKDEDGDDAESDEEDDPLDGILDLDPEDYDEDLVKGVGMLKDFIRKQSKEIKDLRGSLEAAETKSESRSFFDSRVSELDKDYTDELKDSKKRAALRKQFDVLSAGYKATGEEVSQDEIFDQARDIVLGDVKTSIKASKLKKRRSQFGARPGGEKNSAIKDPLDEVADELENKFFK